MATQAESNTSDTIAKPAEKHGDNPTSKESAPAGRTTTGIKWFFCYTSLLSTVFLFALDGTIVSITCFLLDPPTNKH